MTHALLSLTLFISFTLATLTHAAVQSGNPKYYKLSLDCVGGTADFGLGTSGFACTDDRGHSYYGGLVGGGWGGLLALTYFRLEARLERGRKLPGMYYGPSVSVALGLGPEFAYFTRNRDAGWKPNFAAEEYIYLVGVHLGLALDASLNAVYIGAY